MDTTTTPAASAADSSSGSLNSEFLLLFYNTHWHDDLSPGEIQSTMSQWRGWFDGLVAEGKCRGGHPLSDEGRVVSGRSRSVSDGPFAESKEAVCGYFFLQSVDFDEAVRIAGQCPALAYGIKVEVRPVLPNCCAAQASLLEQAAVAAAV